jgi:WD40 repeat protein
MQSSLSSSAPIKSDMPERSASPNLTSSGSIPNPNLQNPNTSLASVTSNIITSTTTDLIVPLTYWYGAPSHTITSILVSPSRSRAVTGSSNGNIFLWTLAYWLKDLKASTDSLNELENESPQPTLSPEHKPIEPAFVLLNPKSKSPITALGSIDYSNIEAFLSVTLDGTITVWSYADGACLAILEKLVKCHPTMMSVLPNGKHVAFAGHSSDIEIVNIKKAKVKTVLSAHTNWVTSLFACDLRGAVGKESVNPVLVSASQDGVLNFWSLRRNESLHPMQTAVVEKGEPISIQLAANAKSLIVVTSQKLMVTYYNDFSHLCSCILLKILMKLLTCLHLLDLDGKEPAM